MQAAAAPRIVFPCAPRDEEIESEAEARLEDDEALAARPARRQIIAAEEDMARLLGPATRAVIDIAKGGGVGRVVAQLVSRRNDRCAHEAILMQIKLPSARGRTLAWWNCFRRSQSWRARFS